MGELLYGSGLRLLECLRLRVKDVDFEYLHIVVRDSKGGKDRRTMLPVSVLSALRVTQRTREIGIRLALGAQRPDVFRLVISNGLKLTASSAAVGLLASLALTRLVAGLLFGVGAGDPVTFAMVVLLLGGVALFANYLPARRATKVDPIVALHEE